MTFNLNISEAEAKTWFDRLTLHHRQILSSMYNFSGKNSMKTIYLESHKVLLKRRLNIN